jgi:hypothetical protein
VLALDAFQKGLDLLPDAETDMRSGICPPHRLCAEEALSLSAEFVKSISRCFGNAASDFKSLSPLSLAVTCVFVCLYAFVSPSGVYVLLLLLLLLFIMLAV